ncbi:MAG: VacJ family lipoprotein [Pseudohongiellaceae bacterium]|nr:VacJ family lipoprotein [Pseudohongiellaceae bacterium]
MSFFSKLFSFNRTPVLPQALAMCLGVSVSTVAIGSEETDPWQNTNTKIFRFNQGLDTWVLKPVASTYNNVVPRVVRQGVGNFFSNIDDINVLANDLLQFKFRDAATDSGRLLVNTTIGIVGIVDVASSMGLQKNEEDFGQTFGAWGVESGPYVMLPFFGPSSVRDSFGLVLDTVFNPIQYHDEDSVRSALTVIKQLDSRASVLAMDDLITGDQYLFLREAYLQQREYLVSDGQAQQDDEFNDFDAWDDF